MPTSDPDPTSEQIEAWRFIARVIRHALHIAEGGLQHAGGVLSTKAISRSSPLNLKVLEREAIIAAVQHAGGNQRRAARLLGVTPSVLSYKIHHVHKDLPMSTDVLPKPARAKRSKVRER